MYNLKFDLKMDNEDYLIEVVGVVGFTIVHLQLVEATLACCWFLHARLENEDVPTFVFEGDFDEIEERNSKKVLGRFLNDIRSSGQFKASFNGRFERFVDKRNRLIHRIFKEKAYENLRKWNTLKRLHRFVSNLLDEAFFFEKVFDAYLGVSYEVLSTREGYIFKEGKIDELERLMAEKRSREDIELLQEALKTRSRRTRRST